MLNAGFADSKTLSHENRSGLLDILSSDPSNLGWSVQVLRYVDNIVAALTYHPLCFV